MTIELAETSFKEYIGPKITIDGLTLIGIYGKARVGKDTVAKYIQTEYETSFIRAFADPLKQYCAVKYGIPLDHFYDEVLKEIVIPFWGVSPRIIAQFEGTEITRNNNGVDFWINHLAGLINGELVDDDEDTWECNCDTTIIIPDVRFQNEYDFIIANNGMVIDMSESKPWGVIEGIRNHISEAGNLNLHTKEQTYALINNGTKPELYAKVEAIMANSIKHRVIYSAENFI